jgi:hypothetical protein
MGTLCEAAMRIHRLFRVSLRSALVIVTFLCICLAWKSKQIRDQKNSVDAILAAGGVVYYDDEYDANLRTPANTSRAYRWLSKNLGQVYVAKVCGVTLYPTREFGADEQVKMLDGVPYLRSLAIWPGGRGKTTADVSAPSGLSDNGLRYIADNLPNLRHLSILASTATADGLRQLEKLDRFDSLQPGALHGGPIVGIDDFLKRNPQIKCN